MKKTTRFIWLCLAVGAAVAFTSGCNDQKSIATTTTSAEKNSFKEVTSRLDAGGDVYVYLSTAQTLEGVSGHIAGWREFFTSLPNTEADKQEQIGRAFDVITSLVKDSGVEEISGVGISAIAVDKSFYRSKIFIHHYPGQGSGFLWNLFGKEPHALSGLDFCPASTAMASFSDLDMPLVWSQIKKQVNKAGLPEADQFLDKLPQQFEQSTGLKWDQVLSSLGGEYGVVLTLDDSRMIAIPVPGTGALQVPEPGLMIVAKVKDDLVFNRIDKALSQHNDQIVKVDKSDLKMRTMPIPLPLPIQLRPTVALSGGYLFIATTDAAIQEALAVKGGQKPGMKSTDEFKRLSKDIPQQGNGFSFVSQRFGQTALSVQQQALRGKMTAAQQKLMNAMTSPDKAAFSYCVSANTDEGWLTVGNGNQQPAKTFIASAAIIPAAIIAAVAVPNFIKARQLAQQRNSVQ